MTDIEHRHWQTDSGSAQERCIPGRAAGRSSKSPPVGAWHYFSTERRRAAHTGGALLRQLTRLARLAMTRCPQASLPKRLRKFMRTRTYL